MRCGNCKGDHKSVKKVRACYAERYQREAEERRVAELAEAAAKTEKKAKGKKAKKEAKVVEMPPKRTEDPNRYYGRGGLPLPFPPGRYAVEMGGTLKFYHVDQPEEGQWKGYVFVKVRASDDLHAIKNREQRTEIIEAIAVDAREAMLTYGKEIGKCGHCGRTLTNEESRKYGMGPICRTKVNFVGPERAYRDATRGR